MWISFFIFLVPFKFLVLSKLKIVINFFSYFSLKKIK